MSQNELKKLLESIEPKKKFRLFNENDTKLSILAKLAAIFVSLFIISYVITKKFTPEIVDYDAAEWDDLDDDYFKEEPDA